MLITSSLKSSTGKEVNDIRFLETRVATRFEWWVFSGDVSEVF